MYSFSLIIPTRRRPQLLKDLVNSIFETANYPSRIELVFAADKDDILTLEYLHELHAKNLSQFKLHVGSPRPHLSTLLNAGGRLATAKYIWCINDDCLFETRRWDMLLEQEIEKFVKPYPDRICYVNIPNDNTPWQESSSFPIITRQVQDAWNGLVVTNEVKGHGQDSALYDIFLSACPTRILNPTQKIIVRHRNIHNGTRELDETQKHVRAQPTRLADRHKKKYVDLLRSKIDGT